ncbi:MAG: hypothetical protein GY865_15000, partial [candidate division Zixibacteria bacterium]|nr:hypothetical protein [candidate division Zixibacteria bacterium]
MRHIKILTFLAVLFLISIGITSAQSRFLISAESPQSVNGDIAIEMDFNIDIYMDNQVEPAEDWCGGGFSFVFYSPDESITEVTYVSVGGEGPSGSVEYLNGYSTMFGIYTAITEIDWGDNLLPDSVNFTQAGMDCMP